MEEEEEGLPNLVLVEQLPTSETKDRAEEPTAQRLLFEGKREKERCRGARSHKEGR